MASFNSVTLVGNLTKDPELQYLPNGSAIVNFSVAINKKYTGKDGEKREEVNFFDVQVWGKQGENCSKYLSKGSAVLISGNLKQQRWEDDNGNKRSRVIITGQNVQFLSSKKDSDRGANDDRDSGGYSGGGQEMPPF